MNTFLHRLEELAHSQGSSLCFVFDDHQYTYLEFWEQIEVLSGKFREGETVIIEETRGDVQLLLWLGAMKKGATPILGHPDMPKERIRLLIEKAKLNGTREEGSVPMHADFGVLTSGSTGLPKIWWRAMSSWVDFFPEQNEVFHTTKESILFVHGSFSFTGNLNAALAVLFEGGAVITSPTLKVTRWIGMLEQYSVTHLYLLPTKMRMVVQKMNLPALGIKVLFMGSQSLDTHLLEMLPQKFPNGEVFFYYGASELNYITYCTLPEWQAHPGIVGKPFKGVSVMVDADDMIVVDTPYGVEGISRPFSIGDRGVWTDDGYLLFLGRADGMINSSGYKISVQGLEDAIRSCEEVQDVAVLSLRDDLRGEVPIAFVVPKEDYKGKVSFEVDLHRELMKHLPTVEVPRIIRMVEELPLNACSKVDKEKLLQLL